jgi:hypothetical protein
VGGFIDHPFFLDPHPSNTIGEKRTDMDSAPNRLRPFRWRALTSVLITAAFLVLVVSGTILFIAPPGRIANWTNWAILGLRKSEWAGLHVVFSALFLLTSIAHILFNWRALLGYFRSRWGEVRGIRLEWLVALIVGFGVYGGTRAGLPPFSTLIAYSESVRQRWETPRQRAPIPHAELLTLQALADQTALDMATVSNRLEGKGIKGFSTNTMVRDLANKSGISAQKLFEIMTATSAVSVTAKGSQGHGVSGDGPGKGRGGGGPGGGLGRKTLTEYCTDEGIDLPTALQRLKSKGLAALASQTVREIAVNNGYSRPYEILAIIRGESQ